MTVLSHLLGLANVASPTLTSLGSRFGLAPLVGKQAAIIGDAHLGRSSDAVAILERLKSIVGGDAQNVDRKGRDELANVVLKARFTVSVNELPRLPDASAALRSRMLLIPFEVSFEGREDHDLQGRLLAEIPGITNWALEGLGDLRRLGPLPPAAGGAGRHRRLREAVVPAEVVRGGLLRDRQGPVRPRLPPAMRLAGVVP